jgi:hypothetical protein
LRNKTSGIRRKKLEPFFLSLLEMARMGDFE